MIQEEFMMEGPIYDPKLTAICNEATIQEEKKGFFNSLVEAVETNTRVREWLQDNCTENMFEIDFINALVQEKDIFDKINETFCVTTAYRKKCSQTSLKIRTEAETLMGTDAEKALLLFHQAVIRAQKPCPKDSLETSNAIARCLLSRARCLHILGKNELALQDLKVALDAINTEKIHYQNNDVKRGENVLISVIKRLIVEYEKEKTDKSMDGAIHIEELTLGESSALKGASNLLKISEGVNEGRYFVAAQKINIGDTLIKEEPYASCLKPKYFGTHCHHCYKRLETPYGCADCATVAFCSISCRDTASSTYHRYECKYLNLFIGSGMSILCYVTLRTVTQIGLKESIENYKKYRTPESKHKHALKSENNAKDAFNTLETPYIDKKCIDEKDNGIDENNAAFFSLCTHTAQRDSRDYLKRMLMSLFLLKCLKGAGFFNDRNNVDRALLSDDEVIICGHLLFTLQMLQFNAHQINEEVDGKSRDIAVGVYSSASLFNHECYPAVTRYFRGKTLIVRAMRPLQSGQTVSDNYGPRFDRQDGIGRQRMLLSRYWFTCKCIACIENWPVKSKSETLPTFRCVDKSCNGKVYITDTKIDPVCLVCKKTQNKEILQKLETLKYCISKSKESKTENKMVLSELKEALDEFHAIAFTPYASIHDAEELLRTHFVNITKIH